jgi:hypothetical protein
MPTRLIRDGILQSERINKLNCEEELFYRRLMSVVDDYGRYYAKPELLRSACFPLKIDKIKNNDISKWLQACAKHMLIICYHVDNTDYLEICDFNQQVRAKRSKYPCVADAKHMITDDHLDEDEDEDEDGRKPDRFPFCEFWNLYPKKDNKSKSETAWNNLTNGKKELAMQDIATRYVNTEKRFVPLATTYIHGERWNDEKQGDNSYDPAIVLGAK